VAVFGHRRGEPHDESVTSKCIGFQVLPYGNFKRKKFSIEITKRVKWGVKNNGGVVKGVH